MDRLFDFHVRLTPQPDALARLVEVLDECGIERAGVAAGGVVDLDRLSRQVVHGGHVESDADNDAVRTACRDSGGRLVPFFFGNPRADGGRYRAAAAGFRGLEISPAVHGVPLLDPRTTDLVQVAAEAGHPVYLVTLGRAGMGAADLARLAGEFPEVTFVLGHCGFIGIDIQAIAEIAPLKNIVVEISGAFTATVRIAVERLGADRVLFGTEFPLQHPTVELAKLHALNLPAESWRLIAWDNADRLLGEANR